MIAELLGLYLVCYFFLAVLRLKSFAFELRSDRLPYYLMIYWSAVDCLSANEFTNSMGWCLYEVLTRVDLFTLSLVRLLLSIKCDFWAWFIGSIYLPIYLYLLFLICRDISSLPSESKSASSNYAHTLLSSLPLLVSPPCCLGELYLYDLGLDWFKSMEECKYRYRVSIFCAVGTLSKLLICGTFLSVSSDVSVWFAFLCLIW